MNFKYVDIENYRSIKKATIEFRNNFMILIGENESGKSNLLKALSLFTADDCGVDDLRMPRYDDDANIDGCIKFGIALDDKDINAIKSQIKKEIIGYNRKSVVIKNVGYDIAGYIDAYCRSVEWVCYFCTGVAKVVPRTGVKFGSISGVICYRVSRECPPDVFVGKVALRDYEFAVTDVVIDGNGVDVVSVEDVLEYVDEMIERYIERSLPSIVRWKYSDASLLPATVDSKSFFESPDLCVPLKNMFIASGYKDSSEITAKYLSLMGNRIAYKNMLRHVADIASKVLDRIWPDKNVSFDLYPDGRNICCAVRDHYNVYDINVRSDGFKRMIAFILDIAAISRNGKFENCFIVMDEPDIGLHPAAIRMLRKELCDLSGKVQIFISTHSTHMIDRDNMDRHLIVRRSDEITTVEIPGESNFYQEEVLYGALTDSIFSVLKKKNIIIEGWYDKKLFSAAIARYAEDEYLFNKFSDVGVCYAGGCKNVKNITPVFEAARRECIVLSDSDDVAKRCQKEFKLSNMHGRWFTYDELLQNVEFVTAEDFIDREYFSSSVTSVVNKMKMDSSLCDFEDIANGNRIYKISSRMSKANMSAEIIKKFLQELKSDIFEEIIWEHVSDSYYVMLERILAEMDANGVK
ncbi:AAA family ATPase [Nitratidesulfovibrio liaohensis]|uniref:ATP-binding protein n=1 Tax=Nitratidesulfovibrio liaohensis TaxID=2604158 RepID=A0ABY9R019_9BACT|nr:AAA family ATPase [Nitratidesulfovibrio liaohensis]WMW64804.1 ATP-binding protein [Nitratidesulfovibrio liaohensis]